MTQMAFVKDHLRWSWPLPRELSFRKNLQFRKPETLDLNASHRVNEGGDVVGDGWEGEREREQKLPVSRKLLVSRACRPAAIQLDQLVRSVPDSVQRSTIAKVNRRISWTSLSRKSFPARDRMSNRGLSPRFGVVSWKWESCRRATRYFFKNHGHWTDGANFSFGTTRKKKAAILLLGLCSIID